jgi:large subunit ribosomal protein L3
MAGLLGRKLGQTHIFDDAGKMVHVTVIEAGPCPVLTVKDKSVQVGFGEVKEKKVKKPVAGYFKKLNVPFKKVIREVPKEKNREYKVGEELKVDIFKIGDKVDVTGTSKGKGFQGGVKRWHWAGGPESHGSTTHRRVGSVGSTTTPGRVLKGHHLPGHMGNRRVTAQNLKVVKIDAENNLLLVEGAVPGHNENFVMIRNARKQRIVLDRPKAEDKKKKK